MKPIQKKETTMKYVKTATPLSAYQVTGLALELSRQADGTILNFEANCVRALDILIHYAHQLEALQTDSE